MILESDVYAMNYLNIYICPFNLKWGAGGYYNRYWGVSCKWDCAVAYLLYALMPKQPQNQRWLHVVDLAQALAPPNQSGSLSLCSVELEWRQNRLSHVITEMLPLIFNSLHKCILWLSMLCKGTVLCNRALQVSKINPPVSYLYNNIFSLSFLSWFKKIKEVQ